jgi:hypothetical protein
MSVPVPDLTPLDEPPDATPQEMLRRERAWHATHRAGALWPGLDGEIIQGSANMIGATVGAILRGERARLAVHGADDDRNARALGVASLLTGVGPLLGAWLERGMLDADEGVARVLARHLAHGRARAARIRSAVMPLLARMSAEGLEPGVIKGFHTGHEHFPEIGARPFADVDVVVAPEHVARAEEILSGARFVAGPPPLGAYKREWTPPSESEATWSHELWHARSPWRLELHDGLNFTAVVQNVRAPQTATLDATLTIDGVALRVAAPGALIAMLATHASGELYSHRLLRLTELVLVIRRARDDGRLDWSGVERSLAETGTTHFAYPALTLVERLAAGTVDPVLLARTRDAATRRIIAVADQLTPTSPVLEQRVSLAERLLWVSGARPTLRRLWLMIAPPSDGPPRARLRVYHDRIVRLLSGGVSVRVGRTPPPDEGP